MEHKFKEYHKNKRNAKVEYLKNKNKIWKLDISKFSNILLLYDIKKIIIKNRKRKNNYIAILMN